MCSLRKAAFSPTALTGQESEEEDKKRSKVKRNSSGDAGHASGTKGGLGFGVALTFTSGFDRDELETSGLFSDLPLDGRVGKPSGCSKASTSGVLPCRWSLFCRNCSILLISCHTDKHNN